MNNNPNWGVSYFWQKSWPQFLQWWRLSVREKRTAHAEQPSTCSSFTQWSAAERPGCSLTDQLKTRPRPSPTTTLLWSLRIAHECYKTIWSNTAPKELSGLLQIYTRKHTHKHVHTHFFTSTSSLNLLLHTLLSYPPPSPFSLTNPHRHTPFGGELKLKTKTVMLF